MVVARPPARDAGPARRGRRRRGRRRAAAPRRGLRHRGHGGGRGPAVADGGGRRRRRVGRDARDRARRGGVASIRRRPPGSATRRRSPTRLPFDDGAFDLALSAFVLQLVPSRYRALREMRRVLRPGGRLAYVTWLRGGERFAGDDEYEEARRDVGLESRGTTTTTTRTSWTTTRATTTCPRPRRPSRSSAAPGSRRRTHARTCSCTSSRPRATWGSSPASTTRTSSRRWTRASATALEHRLLERLRRLPAERLVMRLPIVYASGIRSR